MGRIVMLLSDLGKIVPVFFFTFHAFHIGDETGAFDDDGVCRFAFQIHTFILMNCVRIGNVVRCQMRSLEEILSELNAAEKEYARKCEQYGIEEKSKKKKTDENVRNDEQ